MAEKEYIDKVAFNYAIREAVKKYPNSFYNGLEVARQIAHDFPAADVRPVVLCRDCVYAYPYGLEIKCTKHSGRADRFWEDATYSEFHDESWFCADGEERKHE